MKRTRDEHQPDRLHCLMLGARHTFVRDWARAASAFSDVTLLDVTSEPPPKPGLEWWTGQHGGFRTLWVRKVQPFGSRFTAGLRAALQSERLRRAIGEFEAARGRRVDVIHSHFYAAADPLLRAAARLDIPLIHTEHSSRLIQQGPSRYGRRVLRRLLSQAKGVFCVGEELADVLRELDPSARPLVTANPVDFSAARTRPPGPSRGRLVTTGWLIPRKRHELLLDAVAALHAAGEYVTLTVLGGGDLLARLEEKVQRLGLASFIDFQGNVDRSTVWKTLAKSDLYVHTSEAETFGVALVEAWASGIPAVAVASGGVTTMANDFGGAVVCHPHPDLIAAACRRVLSSLGDLDTHQLAARAQKTFSHERLSAQLCRAYRSATETVAT